MNGFLETVALNLGHCIMPGDVWIPFLIEMNLPASGSMTSMFTLPHNLISLVPLGVHSQPAQLWIEKS